MIDSLYSTYSDRGNTFIAGSSMGGLISLYAICEYPIIFGGAACISTHWIGSSQRLNGSVPKAFNLYIEQNLPSSKNHKIYFDYGTITLDSFYEPYQLKVDKIMISKGFDQQSWETLKFEGENHSERSWSKRLNIPITFLLLKSK